MVGQRSLEPFILVRVQASQHFGKLSAGTYMSSTSPWFVYMLLCDQKTYYVGITNNLIKRFNDHQNKQSFYTKQFSDITLIYCERYEKEHDAAIREKQLKGWSHAKKHKLVSGELGINICTEYAEELVMNGRTL